MNDFDALRIAKYSMQKLTGSGEIFYPSLIL